MKKIEMLTLPLALGGMLLLTGCLNIGLRRPVEVVEEPAPVFEVEEPAPALEVEPIEELVTTHTVVRGDTLWEIAERFYGDPTQWRLIFNANRDILDNPGELKPGQVLVIPRK